MKKTVSVLVALTIVGAYGKAMPKIKPVRLETKPSHSRNLQAAIYFQNFERGASGWTSVDLTDIPAMWHSDAFQAYGGSGKSWWMGDTELKGYDNHWYQVIDSPEITLPSEGDITLSFMMNRCMEDTAGAYAQTEGEYDGWDGCNVRISTNGGNTWTVLNPIDPPYNSTSMYSFGSEHKEGAGIPGWGGSIGGWIPASFDLSGYAGQKIKIRWAFASDPALCTRDSSYFFGWQIDDIKVAGVFTNDGEDTTGFTAASMSQIGGDLWHIETVSDAPSPTHIARCANEAGAYNPHMEDFYVSPLIHFPVEAYFVYGEFALKGLLAGDDQSFPDCDYLIVEISPDTGRTWYAVSNPTGDPYGENYVYLIDTEDQWGVFGGIEDVSCYIGKDVMFRIGVHSNDDANVGTGIFLDDFVIYGEGVGIKEKRHLSSKQFSFSLSSTPLRNRIEILYYLPKDGEVSLKVYNVLGETVSTLFSNNQRSGNHKFSWDARGLSSGVYFVGLKFSGKSLTRKFIVVK